MTHDEVLDAIRMTGERYAEAVTHEMMLEGQRPAIKQNAVLRLMQTTNPETNKLHSGSSAEKVVELDHEYADYRAIQRNAVGERIRAETEFEVAKTRGRLAAGLSAVLS